MKKYFKYILALAAVVFGMTACQQEEEYSSGQPDVNGCYGVFIPSQEAIGDHTFDPTMEPATEFIIKRSDSKGAITVPYTYTESEKGIFKLGQIKFEDGQSETTLKVEFPDAGLGTKYELSIQISDEQYASKYSVNPVAADFSVMRVEWKYLMDPKTKEKAIVTFNQIWWGEIATGYIKYYELDGIRHCYTETLTHFYDGEYYDGYGFFGTGTADNFDEMYFKWYTEDQNSLGNDLIELPMQKAVFVSGAQRYFSDILCYFRDCTGENLDWLKNALNSGDPDGAYPCSYYDGNGGFYFYVTGYYLEDGRGSWTDDYDIIGIASGFSRVDYSLEVELDYAKEGVLPVFFEAGVDVKEIKFAGFEGELSKVGTEKAAEEIQAATEESTLEVYSITEFTYDETIEKNVAFKGIELEKTGTYTIVAVAYDAEGNVQGFSSVAGPYVAAADSEDNAVVVSVGTEDISPRYESEGYLDSNSFGYYILGEDVTEAHYTIFKEESYNEKEAEYNALVKAGVEGVTVLDEEGLASLNGEGGYSNIVTGLDALTDYVVVVWATNGVSDTFVKSSYSTNGLPNELVSNNAAYIYTIWDAGYDPETEESYPYLEENLTLEWDPNQEMYVLQNWSSAGIPFYYSYDEETGEISVPTQELGVYTGMESYGSIHVCETANLPEDYIDYFGIDITKKNYVGEDGGLYLYLSYFTPIGYYMGTGYEVLYPEGVPAAAGTQAKTGSFSKTLVDLSIPQFDKVPYERSVKSVSMEVVDLDLSERTTKRGKRAFSEPLVKFTR